MPYLVELLDDFVHHLAAMMFLMFMEFPLGGFGSFSHMLGNVMQSSFMQMINSNPHVLQATCDFILRGTIVFMMWLPT